MINKISTSFVSILNGVVIISVFDRRMDSGHKTNKYFVVVKAQKHIPEQCFSSVTNAFSRSEEMRMFLFCDRSKMKYVRQ